MVQPFPALDAERVSGVSETSVIAVLHLRARRRKCGPVLTSGDVSTQEVPLFDYSWGLLASVGCGNMGVGGIAHVSAVAILKGGSL